MPLVLLSALERPTPLIFWLATCSYCLRHSLRQFGFPHNACYFLLSLWGSLSHLYRRQLGSLSWSSKFSSCLLTKVLSMFLETCCIRMSLQDIQVCISFQVAATANCHKFSESKWHLSPCSYMGQKSGVGLPGLAGVDWTSSSLEPRVRAFPCSVHSSPCIPWLVAFSSLFKASSGGWNPSWVRARLFSEPAGKSVLCFWGLMKSDWAFFPIQETLTTALGSARSPLACPAFCPQVLEIKMWMSLVVLVALVWNNRS
jgi:hypothetical protein